MDDERVVVDRFEDRDLAVLLVGDDEVEHVVPRSELPDGAVEGNVLRVQFDAGRLVSAELDLQDTEETRRRIEDKMDRLRSRGRKL